MHSHDHDLIAALAEGILAEGLAASAEAEIAACPECAAELAGQRLAIRSLGALTPATLSADESAGLRSAVATELGLATAPAPAPAALRRRRASWAAAAVAAGVAGVIMAVPVVGSILGGADDDADTTNAPVAAVFDDGEAEGADALDLSDDPARTEMLQTEPSATSEAATTTMAAMAGGTEESLSATTEAAAEDTIPDAATPTNALKGEADLRAMFEAGRDEEALAYGEQAARSTLTCNAEAEQQIGNEAKYLDVDAALDDGRAVIVYVDAGWTILVAFDAEDCSVALTLP